MVVVVVVVEMLLMGIMMRSKVVVVVVVVVGVCHLLHFLQSGMDVAKLTFMPILVLQLQPPLLTTTAQLKFNHKN